VKPSSSHILNEMMNQSDLSKTVRTKKQLVRALFWQQESSISHSPFLILSSQTSFVVNYLK
jgi:predicted transposase YbfD/YdcC